MKALALKLWARLGPWLRGVLSENNGTPSSSRVLMLGWHVLVAGVWLADCWIHRHMAAIDNTVLVLLGIVGGQKVANKFAEPDGPPADK